MIDSSAGLQDARVISPQFRCCGLIKERSPLPSAAMARRLPAA
jgi:hypothetical protein